MKRLFWNQGDGALGQRAKAMEGKTREATRQEQRLMTMKMMMIRRLKTP